MNHSFIITRIKLKLSATGRQTINLINNIFINKEQKKGASNAPRNL